MRVSRALGTKLFLICGALLFAIGIFFISNRHRLFTKTFVVYADFDRLNGIEKGATVRLSGLQAGEVISTEITKWPEGRLRLKLLLGEDLHPFVRTDSVASIRTSGLAGNTFLDIEKGTAKSAQIGEGGTLPTAEPIELADLMRESSMALRQSQVSLKAIQEQADTTMQTIATLTQHADGTLLQLQPNLVGASVNAREATRRLDELTREVQQGQGLAGEIMTSTDLARSVADTVSNTKHATLQLDEASARLNASLGEFQNRKFLERSDAVLVNTQQLTSRMNGMLATPDGATPINLQATLASTQRAISNLADDTEAVKHNFLLRGFFKNRGYYDLQGMNPSAYRSSKFLQGHTHKRDWIASEDLFLQGPEEHEMLSPAGQKQIDAAIGTEISSLPNNALMVEGYSNAGTPDQQFLVAQSRAALVRGYLIKRFSLQPDLVGVMPMGSVTPSGTQHAVWNGVSIVVLTPQ